MENQPLLKSRLGDFDRRQRRRKKTSSFMYLDMYAQEVKLTFRNQDKFYTIPGAIISIIVILAVITYGGYTALGLFNRDYSKIVVNSTKRVLTNDQSDPMFATFEQPEYNPDLRFAVGLRNRITGLGESVPSSVGTFKAYQLDLEG